MTTDTSVRCGVCHVELQECAPEDGHIRYLQADGTHIYYRCPNGHDDWEIVEEDE